MFARLKICPSVKFISIFACSQMCTHFVSVICLFYSLIHAVFFSSVARTCCNSIHKNHYAYRSLNNHHNNNTRVYNRLCPCAHTHTETKCSDLSAKNHFHRSKFHKIRLCVNIHILMHVVDIGDWPIKLNGNACAHNIQTFIMRPPARPPYINTQYQDIKCGSVSASTWHSLSFIVLGYRYKVVHHLKSMCLCARRASTLFLFVFFW